MTTSNHVYAGAAIAMAVKQPALALPLAFLSHFVLDALPHYGREGIHNFKGIFKHRTTVALESLNLLAIPFLIYLTWNQSWWVWLAAIVAISPDLSWVYRYLRFEWYGLDLPDIGSWFTRFHLAIQWCERKWGILLELPMLLGLVLLSVELAAW
jgi:hypothetical protein